MQYTFFADVLLIFHFGIVLFNVGMVPFVAITEYQNHPIARNSWLRNIHVGLILFVVGETLLGRICPLTLWESDLRRRGGGTGYEGDFIAHHLRELMYFDFPMWVFALVYVGFGLLVVWQYWRYPPRWPRRAVRVAKSDTAR